MKHNSLYPAVLLIGLLFSGVILLFVVEACTMEKGEIVIGAILPLSGDVAQYGVNCKNGIELAVDEVNTEGGIRGRKIKIVFEDSKASPRDAVSAFRKLITVDKVSCVIGPLASSCAMATAPIANENEVVSFSPGASTPRLTDAGEFVFRNWQSDTLEAHVMSEYAYEQGWERIAIFYINNDFGKSLSDYFKENYEHNVGSIIIVETFEQNSTDFRTQLTKIKSTYPDAIYLLSYPKETPLILNQATELDVECKFLGVAAFEDPSIIEIAGRNAEGIIYTHAIPPAPDDPAYSHFIEEYLARYGEAPGLIADTGYDAVHMLVEAYRNIESQEFSGIEIARSLGKIKDFPGASGRMSFDENGDVIKPIGIKTVRGGGFVWLRK